MTDTPNTTTNTPADGDDVLAKARELTILLDSAKAHLDPHRIANLQPAVASLVPVLVAALEAAQARIAELEAKNAELATVRQQYADALYEAKEQNAELRAGGEMPGLEIEVPIGELSIRQSLSLDDNDTWVASKSKASIKSFSSHHYVFTVTAKDVTFSGETSFSPSSNVRVRILVFPD